MVVTFARPLPAIPTPLFENTTVHSGEDTVPTSLTVVDAGLPTLIPRTVLFGNPERINPALSPDGRRVAWVAPVDGVLNLWVADLDELADREDAGRPVTADTGQGITAYAWSPDGSRLVYVQDQDGNMCLRLYGVHLDTGDTRSYTPADGTQARVLGASKHHPGQLLIGLNRDDRQRHDAYLLDLDSGELSKVCDAQPGFIGMLADDDLVVRAALRQNPDAGRTLLTLDSDGGWRELLEIGFADTMTFIPVSISRDDTRLLAVSALAADTAELVWIDLTTGEQTAIAADPDFDIAGVHVDVTTRQPLIAAVRRDRLHLLALDGSVDDDVAAITGLGGDISIVSTDHNNEVWLVASRHDNGPTRYFTYHRGTGKTALLFHDQPALNDHVLAAMEPFTLGARDGLTLHGYLTAPVGVPRRDLPTVVLPHGGPTDSDGLRWLHPDGVRWPHHG